MRVLPITESWLSSESAQEIYFICACVILGSIIFAVALITADSLLDQTTLEASSLIKRMTEMVVFATAVAGAVLVTGMWYHALRPGGLEGNAFWLLGLLLLGGFGTLLYYFFYYRRHCLAAGRTQSAVGAA